MLSCGAVWCVVICGGVDQSGEGSSFSRVNVCFVSCILGGAEEHEEQSGGAGVVRDSAEALPEVEGKAMAECGIHD